ncbi:unnamed protein product [Vitrella brassicaformis CCMP3155]|uniref:Apple domain-containing protein n=2 Tax=Vitrella brassicaformis TaxID=1169539 RepID=A0A0G4EI75_VITBC|nr:unnamed protein product [Vitrella brassicaformis CCMP3155]|mmetsp:Transcript_39934/g.99931  ORF Transcript_39934/g.99931 Transcript_39934/m.99931 type:complete len:1519 (+) Transcript_39934:131-4687(+)|eukprot:CEL96695.1 unnamed protein product [Vitrella brassicaformis CCMP3155]
MTNCANRCIIALLLVSVLVTASAQQLEVPEGYTALLQEGLNQSGVCIPPRTKERAVLERQVSVPDGDLKACAGACLTFALNEYTPCQGISFFMTRKDNCHLHYFAPEGAGTPTVEDGRVVCLSRNGVPEGKAKVSAMGSKDAKKCEGKWTEWSRCTEDCSRVKWYENPAQEDGDTSNCAFPHGTKVVGECSEDLCEQQKEDGDPMLSKFASVDDIDKSSSVWGTVGDVLDWWFGAGTEQQPDAFTDSKQTANQQKKKKKKAVKGEDDCKGFFTPWSPCDEETCTQERQYRVVMPKPGTDDVCKFPDGEKQTRECPKCPEKAAPQDCKGSWSSWSSCSADCTQERIYAISRPAKNGGKACPVKNGMVELQVCAGEECTYAGDYDYEYGEDGYVVPPILTPSRDCRGDWLPWSECDKKKCKRVRSYMVKESAAGKGDQCPYAHGELQEEGCMEELCDDLDCLGQWGEWGKCDEDCEQQRIFRLEREAVGGGKECLFEDRTKQKRTCEGGECPADKPCVGDWGKWSKCSEECEQERVFTITANATGKGDPCPEKDGATETRECDDDECDGNVDCKGEWGDWGECDDKCETVRTFNVTREAKGKGDPCDYEDQDQEKRTCPKSACKLKDTDCVGGWGEWSKCGTNCTRSRVYTIKEDAVGEGEQCPYEDGDEEIEECDDDDCEIAVDCEYEWGDWSDCDEKCEQKRTLKVTQEPEGKGKNCPRPDGFQERRKCKDDQCAADCKGQWTKWSECSDKCQKERVYEVLDKAEGDGKACPFDDGDVEMMVCDDGECNKGATCTGEWLEWSKCTKDCRRERRYKITSPAATANNCPYTDDAKEEEECTGDECETDVDCEGKWSEWEECDPSCLTTRTFTITSPARGKGADCPAKDDGRESRPCQHGDGQCKRLNCEGTFNEWSKCDDSCVQRRRFDVFVENEGLGEGCLHEDGFTEERQCDANKCDKKQETEEDGTTDATDCDGEWSNWSACDVDCIKRRTYTVRTFASNGGKECPFADGEIDDEDCKHGEGICDLSHGRCSQLYDSNCRVTRCCQDPDAQCIQKNEFFAHCRLADDVCPPPGDKDEWACINITSASASGAAVAHRNGSEQVSSYPFFFALRLLDLKFDDLRQDEEKSRMLQASLETSLARTLKVEPRRVRLKALMKGSVVVLFSILDQAVVPKDSSSSSSPPAIAAWKPIETSWKSLVSDEGSALHRSIPHNIDHLYNTSLPFQDIYDKYLEQQEKKHGENDTIVFLSALNKPPNGFSGQDNKDTASSGNGDDYQLRKKQTGTQMDDSDAPNLSPTLSGGSSSRTTFTLVLSMCIAIIIAAVIACTIMVRRHKQWLERQQAPRHPTKGGSGKTPPGTSTRSTGGQGLGAWVQGRIKTEWDDDSSEGGCTEPPLSSGGFSPDVLNSGSMREQEQRRRDNARENDDDKVLDEADSLDSPSPSELGRPGATSIDMLSSPTAPPATREPLPVLLATDSDEVQHMPQRSSLRTGSHVSSSPSDSPLHQISMQLRNKRRGWV